MSTDEISTTSADAPPKIVGKIESDLFCPHCNYNMHGLNVLRDARLEILVVRCPECGKFQPAGVATRTTNLWLNRLAMFLIIAWIAFIALAIFLGGLALFGFDIGIIDGFVESYTFYTPTGSTYKLIPYWSSDPRRQLQMYYFGLLMWSGAFAFAWLWSSTLTVLLWQHKRKWLFLLCIVPLLSAGAAAIYFAEKSHRFDPSTFSWITNRVVMQMLIQVLGIACGIFTGRAIARGILRAILTRRMLVHFHFLWTTDNKTPPKPKS